MEEIMVFGGYLNGHPLTLVHYHKKLRVTFD